jgi:hypothetical protein
MSRTPLIILASEIGFMLEEAIDKKDWNLVCQVFSELTGEEKTVKDDKDTNSFSKEFLSALRKELGQEKKTQPKKQAKKTPEPKPPDYFSATTKKRKRSSPVVPDGKNKFDSMHDAIAEAGQDKNFDKIDDRVKPTERTRKPFSERQVECTECNKSVKVHPMFIKENYVCDSCVQKKTRGRS